jgi:hypothetical protein
VLLQREIRNAYNLSRDLTGRDLVREDSTAMDHKICEDMVLIRMDVDKVVLL